MADRYWVGGTGDWDASTTTHWGSASGTADNASVPTFSDNVIFNSGSASDDYTVTITATANCLDFTMDKPTGVGKKVTWAGSSTLNIYGSMNLSGGTAGITRTYSGQIAFLATATGKTVDTNEVTLASYLNFNGVGGGWTLSNDINNGTSALEVNKGTFDTANKTITVGNFSSSSASTRTFTLGSSTINCNLFNTTNNTGLTFTANTAIIIVSGSTAAFAGGGYTFSDVRITTSTSASYIDGANSFGLLTITGSTLIKLNSNQTVTTTLTITGSSAVNRIFIQSNTLGTARTITAATVVVTNADFQDITGAGAGDWDLSAITGGSGNCGGNTGITFTTADDWYWHVDGGNTNNYAKWYTATNGGGSQMASTMVPLPQDILHFDANSFDSGSQTVTQNMSRIGSIDFTGATNTPTFTTSTVASVFGSITLISGMTLTASTQAYTLAGRGSYTLDSGGKSWAKAFTINAPGGTITLKSNFTMAKDILLTITNGTLSCVDGANNWIISAGRFQIGAAATVSLGSGTHLATWDGSLTTLFQSFLGATFSANTSTLKFNGALTANVYLDSGTVNYNGMNFWNATTNNFALVVIGSGTFNDFKIDAGRTVKFTNSTNTTVTTFTALGTSGSHITLSNTSGTTHATLTKAGSGLISGCDYIDASYLTGSPADTWYIGANSTDAVGSSLTNIYLLDGPVSGNTTDFFHFF